VDHWIEAIEQLVRAKRLVDKYDQVAVVKFSTTVWRTG
jgi:hypothetical protein